MKEKDFLRIAVCIIAVAASMRSPTGGVGPLVPLIKAEYGFSSSVSGLLTAIPIALFGITAAFAGALTKKIGIYRLTLICLIVSCAGTFIRSQRGVVSLFAGTVLIGVSIGIINVVLPTYIKKSPAKWMGAFTGMYSSSINLFSAIASGTALMLSALLGSWRYALLVFGVLPLTALPIWAILAKERNEEIEKKSGQAAEKSILRRTSSQLITLLMGMQALLYFSLVTWLPSIIIDKTGSAAIGSFLLLMMQTVGLITNFSVPVIIQKSRMNGMVSAFFILIFAAGIAIIMIAGEYVPAAVFGTVFLGLGIGSCLGIVLIFTALVSHSTDEAASLSAFSQSVGYLIATPGPFILGTVFDASLSWDIPLFLLLVFCLLMAVAGFFAERFTRAELARLAR